MINSNARRRPAPAILAASKAEWPVRVGVAVWFFFLATFSINQS